MAALRMEAPSVCRSSSAAMQLNCRPHRQLPAVTVPVSTRWQVLSTFPGQRLSRHARHNSFPSRQRRVAVAQAFPRDPDISSTVPKGVLGAEHMLDDLARYVYYKIKNVVAPHLPREYDPLAFLPKDLHNSVHKGEVWAIILVREVLHFSLFYFLFCRVEAICEWLNWLYKSYEKKDLADHDYENSNFRAMGDPLRFLIFVWAATRACHIIACLMKINVEPFVTAKIRASGIVIAVTWFGFKIKQLFVEQLISTNRTDAVGLLPSF